MLDDLAGTHEEIVIRNDRDTGLRAVIVVDDTTLGPALGGVRMVPYGSLDDALTDASRLAGAMTKKAALAGLPLGGGKSVIVGDPEHDKSESLLLAMGRFVQSLGGRYIPGIDSGTTQDDLRVIGREAAVVSCVGADPSPWTAAGVFAAVKSGIEHLDGAPDLAGRRVVVHGVGHVGSALARMLSREGADLVLSDIREEVAASLARGLGARAVATDAAVSTPCDVYAPCALGAVINDDSLPLLDARLVAGAANNVLAEARHGVELFRRGVLYAPDYCANAGGIIFLVAEMRRQQELLPEQVGAIGATLAGIWARSRDQARPPELVADALAAERIAAGRHAKEPGA